MKNKKGALELLPVVAVIALVVLVGMAGVAGYRMGWFSGDDTAAVVTTDSQGNPVPVQAAGGAIVESLSVTQVNKYTSATEGGDDVEFWDLGANINDASKTPRETLDLSSGAVTDTSVPALLSTDSHLSKDLYVEGTGSYYDDKIAAWSIKYNEQTGKGVLVANGPSGAVIATDVGTFADIDVAQALGTGFSQTGAAAGHINYTDAVGADGGYFRIDIGNTEADSELRDVAFCIGDADSDMEGDEITSLSISPYGTAPSVNFPSTNIIELFTKSAGTGSMYCVNAGSIMGIKTGTYQLDFTIVEANTDAGNEEIEFGLDDLGGWKVRQEPSGNLKATAEDLILDFTT